jgi:hypothetical protein
MRTPHSTKDEEPKEEDEEAVRIALTFLGSFAAIVLFIWGMFSLSFALKALVSLSNEACNARGICSPCAWSTPNIANALKPRNSGWDAPGCRAYVNASAPSPPRVTRTSRPSPS